MRTKGKSTHEKTTNKTQDNVKYEEEDLTYNKFTKQALFNDDKTQITKKLFQITKKEELNNLQKPPYTSPILHQAKQNEDYRAKYQNQPNVFPAFPNCKQNETYYKAIEKAQKTQFVKDKPETKEIINRSQFSVKDLLKFVGYSQLLEDLKAKILDSSEIKNLKEENKTLKYQINDIISEYEKKLCEKGEEIKELKEKILTHKNLENKLNNELRREKSKSPAPVFRK